MAQASAMIESPPPDPEAGIRRDLTHLKVYAIDSEDTNEVSRWRPRVFVVCASMRVCVCCGGLREPLTALHETQQTWALDRDRRPDSRVRPRPFPRTHARTR